MNVNAKVKNPLRFGSIRDGDDGGDDVNRGYACDDDEKWKWKC